MPQAPNQSSISEIVYPFLLPVSLIVAYLYYIFVSSKGTSYGQTSVVHIVMFCLFVYGYYLYNVQEKVDGNLAKMSDDAFVEKITKDVKYHIETDQVSMYPDSMSYRQIRFDYIPKHPDIVTLLKDIYFTKHFDKAAYTQVKILSERFLALYYDMLLQSEPECALSFPKLKAMRKELLNTFHNLIINVPIQFKRVFRKKVPTDKYLHIRLRKLQAITYSKLQIISNKCDTRKEYDLRFKPPWGSNEFENQHTVF